MKRKRLFGILAAAISIGIFSGGAYAEEEVVFGTTDGFEAEAEVPENATFAKVAWMDNEIYGYSPSELYDPISGVMPVFYVFTDEPLADINAAWEKLGESGLMELAEQTKADVYFFNPVDGEVYSDADVEALTKFSKALAGTRGLDYEYAFPHGSVQLKNLYVIGEGKGADFVASYLTNDVYSGMVAGNLLIGASESVEENYAVPAYLVNCSDEVVDFYKSINGTDAEDTVEGRTVYYNSEYLMDSGYTPKRVFIGAEDIDALTPELAQEAWSNLFRRVWNNPIVYDYFTEGVEAGDVADHAIPEELGLTFNEITGEEAEGTTQTRWYEWVPNEVYDTIENGTDETYPLIVVNHGNGDHELYEADSNGWVKLAGDERVIVVAMKDIFTPAMPPESGTPRYGKENAAFIRDVICEKYPVDMSRIYIAGFSIGAFVTADTAAAAPDLFAAAAPMAYPADGYMQIFPYDEYESDADKYDMPFINMNGTADRGNTMSNPTAPPPENAFNDPNPRVYSKQLLLNQIMIFNEMTDSLIDLVDFAYDWYPGENDAKEDRETGEIVGGYDFWDGTAAQYIVQNLDFDAYPYYGFDFASLPNTTEDNFTTPEGVEVTRYTISNEEGWPMVVEMQMGNMGHNHYGRYANILWNDFFSHYSRNPETGVLSYDGVEATK